MDYRFRQLINIIIFIIIVNISFWIRAWMANRSRKEIIRELVIFNFILLICIFVGFYGVELF